MAVVTEIVTLGGRDFTRTWSDAGKLIEREGVRYSEAYDPADMAREYAETDEDAPAPAMADGEGW